MNMLLIELNDTRATRWESRGSGQICCYNFYSDNGNNQGYEQPNPTTPSG